ncbi:alpha/beta hydrolase [Pontixanthobacter aquaemixtae]|uniref:Alpha/beta fold hydrolase n=1 Tax=Pontixanthobacter aquaemixtae TaxID=1958940 RepID=A0A844ZQA0_9SPHN|nr:alpha/beta hydrolase [Pontixanthobacter aquaemixtae]MXO90521.1 alpha/beta fold hydrolase [Pontixanthobacter aquaemixtae]
MKPVEIVLLHGPLVGPASVEPTRQELQSRGLTVVVPKPANDQANIAWRDWPASLTDRLPKLDLPVFVGHSMGSLLAARMAADYAECGMICLDGDIPCLNGPTPPVAASFRPIIEGLPQSDRLLPPWHKWWPSDPFQGWPVTDAEKARVSADIPQLRFDWFDDSFIMPNWDHAAKGFIQLNAWFDEESKRAEKLGFPVERIEGTHLHPAVAPVETADAIIACIARMERPN